MNDARIEVSKNAMLQKIMTRTHFSKNPVDESKLKAFTDSSMLSKPLPTGTGIDSKTVLFSFPQKKYTVNDWIQYRKEIPASIGKGKSIKEMMDLYTKETAFSYYSEHLEEYDKDFATQLTDFKEGNLLFEVMQQKIWNKAASDSSGLQSFYKENKNKYLWSPVLTPLFSPRPINQQQTMPSGS